MEIKFYPNPNDLEFLGFKKMENHDGVVFYEIDLSKVNNIATLIYEDGIFTLFSGEIDHRELFFSSLYEIFVYIKAMGKKVETIKPYYFLDIKHYQAIRKRGKITDETNHGHFCLKLQEEIKELKAEYVNWFQGYENNFIQELIDVESVIKNFFIHEGINYIEEKEKNIKIQEDRANGK